MMHGSRALLAILVVVFLRAGNAFAHDPNVRVVRRDGPIDHTLLQRDWRKGAGSSLDIRAHFEDAHRLTGSVTVNDRLRQTSASFAIHWEWTVRGDRLDITMPDENGEADHADCRITLQRQHAFVLSDCRRSPDAVDIAGIWTLQRTD